MSRAYACYVPMTWTLTFKEYSHNFHRLVHLNNYIADLRSYETN